MRKLILIGAAALSIAVLPGESRSATVFDPVGDFLPSFVGAKDPDLDVTSFSVLYDSATTTFTLGAVFAGVIDPSKPGFYVFGVNTGTGTSAPFGAIGQPNVRFNQAVSIQKAGTGTVSGAAGGPLATSGITIIGNQLIAKVPLALLPSTGFDPFNYGWNLWPRNGSGNNNQISDFSPENATIAVAVPEPASWALMLAGFGLAGAALRRQRRLRVSFG